jgi:hypothetical protein
MPPKAAADPLASLLRAAIRRTTDPRVRRWLSQLTAGESACQAPAALARPGTGKVVVGPLLLELEPAEDLP